MAPHDGAPSSRLGLLHRHKSSDIRYQHVGSSSHHGDHHHNKNGGNFDSLTYVSDESDLSRGAAATDHMNHRGKFWNQGKHTVLIRYLNITATGVIQAMVAYFTNIVSLFLIERKFEIVNAHLEKGHPITAFFTFVLMQLTFACVAAGCVYIAPVAAGSGIPEVKCFLNGVHIPHIAEVKTLIAKVIGVIGSVSAGLPVGKEGPMVHSGAVVASTIMSAQEQSSDRPTRDLVACGAAAGVCTAFSAPVGGILFALEEGASFWGPSQTWRTFFCSMIAFMTLLLLNTIGSAFGKVGFNKLFSFGQFKFEGEQTAYHTHELFYFILIGVIGGFVGAIFNATNEHITLWRIKRVNHSKKRRVYEVVAISILVSVVCFTLPLLFGACRPLPSAGNLTAQQSSLVEELVPFLCKSGEEYNEVASLIFTEPGVAIRQLFHLHTHVFSGSALLMFFMCYISLAVVVYGIAIPSGLFVPSLLSGAALGRLIGNVAHMLHPGLALSTTYSLIGAAAVLGGMARMTISLTVILLECTGNEQFVLPLMLTLMTARIVGGLFNDDLYHIHIHMKKGVEFLEAELQSVTRHHNLITRDFMSANVIFVKPVEKVGVVYDILRASTHSNFVVVDNTDRDVLYGTIGRAELMLLLREREFGLPAQSGEVQQAHYLDVDGDRYIPLIPWKKFVRGSRSSHTSAKSLRISQEDREFLVDVRPYTNTAPVSVYEFSSIERTYDMFRSLGLRFLPVVNRYNQVVGTISRSDLTPDSLAEAMLTKGKRHC